MGLQGGPGHVRSGRVLTPYIPFPGILSQSDKMVTDFRKMAETSLDPCLNCDQYVVYLFVCLLVQVIKMNRQTKKKQHKKNFMSM